MSYKASYGKKTSPAYTSYRARPVVDDDCCAPCVSCPTCPPCQPCPVVFPKFQPIDICIPEFPQICAPEINVRLPKIPSCPPCRPCQPCCQPGYGDYKSGKAHKSHKVDSDHKPRHHDGPKKVKAVAYAKKGCCGKY